MYLVARVSIHTVPCWFLQVGYGFPVRSAHTHQEVKAQLRQTFSAVRTAMRCTAAHQLLGVTDWQGRVRLC